jgi:hypothetical protein
MKMFVSLDLKKAFDSISRAKLFEIFRKGLKKDEKNLVNLIINF